jgi:imidazolonepropionase-like amidohydrolase
MAAKEDLMRGFGLGLSAIVLFVPGLMAAATGGAPPSPKALVGATLVDGTGGPFLRDAVVLMRDGKIACVGSRKACPVPEGVEVLDATGMWVTPGLVDAHVHFAQTGWADGRPDALDMRDRYPYEQVEAGLRTHPERFFRADLCSGVTAVFDVGGYPWSWDMRARAESDTGAPHVAASGPLLSTRDFWLNLPAEKQFIYLSNEKATREGVRYLAANGADAVKIWYIPVTTRGFDEMAAVVKAAGDEAKKVKLPLIVHATGLREAKVGLQAGAKLLVHGVRDAEVDEEFIAMARANGTIYCPTLTVGLGYMRMFEAVLRRSTPSVDDPNGCVDAVTLAHIAETSTTPLERGLDQGRYELRKEGFEAGQKIEAENLMKVVAAGIPVAMGTDAGNPLTLHGPSVYAEMEAMQRAGMTPMQVVMASTRTAALAMGRLADLGTVEKGKVADLVVLAGDPLTDVSNFRKVRFVVRGGQVRSIAELAAPAR